MKFGDSCRFGLFVVVNGQSLLVVMQKAQNIVSDLHAHTKGLYDLILSPQIPAQLNKVKSGDFFHHKSILCQVFQATN